MPITIGSNIASLTAQRRLAEGTSQLSKTYERLSSGQRINRAADDAAGLAISESLKSDRRVFNQGVRNFNDGISLLNIADGAIENLSNIVIRLKELAEQSANGTYSTTQRSAIDKEAQALSKEYTRIARSTTFNGRNLFDYSTVDLRLQGGFGLNGGITSSLGGAIGNGSFQTAKSYDGVGNGLDDAEGITDMKFGDLNGDGVLDQITAEAIYGANGGQIAIRFGNGDGSFANASTYSISSVITSSFAIGDINSDGKDDIVAISGNSYASVLLNRGNGTFSYGATFSVTGGESRSTELVDINNDNNLDFVSLGGSGVEVRLGTGNGTFGNRSTYFGLTGDMKIGDLNNDGNLDFITVGSAGRAIISNGRGDGTFSTGVTYLMDTGTTYALELSDVNSDGYLDMIAAGSNLSVRLGSASGTFGNSITSTISGGGLDLAAADLNGDGFADLALSRNSSVSEIRLGNGNGTFTFAASYSTEPTIGLGNSTPIVVFGDLNGDGVYDLGTAGLYQSSIRLATTSSGVSSLLNFSLASKNQSLDALDQFSKALDRIASQRGQIGAYQSRVQVGINNLQASSENYAAAESRIKDADIAHESSQLLRLNILQQAASSVLGQANLQPQLALRLLGGA